MSAVLAWIAGTRLGRWVAGVLLAVGALIAAYAWASGRGARGERDKTKDRVLDTMEEAQRVRRELEGFTDEELEERGRPWLRR